MTKIVLITTGQPSTNPRIVKEADSLVAEGFDVTVLYCHFIDWATKADERLLQNVKWDFRLVGGSPYQNKVLYFFTRLRYKLFQFISKKLGNNMHIAERVQARCYDELLIAAKAIKSDWYIGHNLGALPVVIKAAQYHQAKAGFDFEDYHRGENNTPSHFELDRVIYLENKYLPHLSYISAASPMIAEKIVQHFPDQRKNVITLLNCFQLKQQPALRMKQSNDETLQLFWFSQTIGLNRGLEILIDALQILNNTAIHLTLVGRKDPEMTQYVKAHAAKVINNIHFEGIIPPDSLPAFAAQFDVGLAIELCVPINRDICLTNKIFTYLLAGNAIILSETSMQSSFNRANQVGESFAINDKNKLAEVINGYFNHEKLYAQRQYNYDLASTQFNWEMEFGKLLSIIQL